MSLVERQKGSRRDGLPVKFPLTDSQGVFVVKDRRRLSDRRDPEHSIDDYMKTKLPIMGGHIVRRLIFISLIVAINVIFVLMAYAMIVAIKN